MMIWRFRNALRFATYCIFILIIPVAGCIWLPSSSEADSIIEHQQTNDPVELANRLVFRFNNSIDAFVLKPVARGYRSLPQAVKNSTHNFLNNWNEPQVFVHDLLQCEFKRASETIARFATNTTIGFLGISDIALANLEIHHHDEDMGQTLAVWGISDGPYIVLPLIGPSNVRDTIGHVADFFLDPINLAVTIPTTVIVSKMSVEGIRQRERHLDVLNDLEQTSLDYYTSLRTLYRQLRTNEINNGYKNDLVADTP